MEEVLEDNLPVDNPVAVGSILEEEVAGSSPGLPWPSGML